MKDSVSKLDSDFEIDFKGLYKVTDSIFKTTI